MARPTSKHPTELELRILKTIWKQGSAATVRQVRDALAEPAESESSPSAGPRDLALTTVTTMLNIMVEKDYLNRKRLNGRFVYAPIVTKEQTSSRIVSDLIDRVFDGSPSALVLNLLDHSEIRPDELKDLQRLIDKRTGKHGSTTRRTP